jgi:hypothetical protein
MKYASYHQAFLDGIAATIEEHLDWHPYVEAPSRYRSRGEQVFIVNCAEVFGGVFCNK